MSRPLLTLMVSGFLMASSMGMVQAQSSGDEATAQQGQRMAQSQQGERMMQQGMQRGQRMMQQGMQRGQRMSQRGQRGYGRYRDGRPGMMRQHRRGGDGMGMMGHGMGHGAMMQILFALMDADGDGTLSLEEVQEAHARIFAHIDADGDGQLTKEEIRAFFRGGKERRGPGWRDRPETNVGDDNDDDN